jgi:hypothetical protein
MPLARVRAVMAKSVKDNNFGNNYLNATSSALKENHYGKRLSYFSL